VTSPRNDRGARERSRRCDDALPAVGSTITLIVPAYNEASHLSETLPRLRAEFGDDPQIELLVVDDGSTDDTPDIVLAHIDGWETARLVRLPWNQGKGAAIKAGVALSNGSRLIFMDADLSADIADVPRLAAALDHADVAIGSRQIAGSRVIYNQHRSYRKVQSKLFNGVACVMVDIVASDTQCGFKAFRADAGKLLFHLCEGKGFAFDVELLALAQLLELKVTEVPIDWVESVGTTVKAIRDPLRMMRDLLRTRRRCRKLEQIAGRYVWEVHGPQSDFATVSSKAWIEDVVAAPVESAIEVVSAPRPAPANVETREPAPSDSGGT
jgi:glycosyltransferase involved in cell wall biosynthesis